STPSMFTAQQLRELTLPQQDVLIPLDAGGLAAWVLRLPPKGRTDAPEGAAAGAGRFYVLTQGSLSVLDGELGSLAVTFVSREDALDLRAGANGAELLVLQFPEAALQPMAEEALSD